MPDISSTIKRFLKTANQNWAEEATRSKEQSGFERIDDGKYVLRVSRAELVETKSSSRPAVVTSFVVMEGENKGATVNRYRMLDGEDGLFWFGKDMAVFGYDPAEIHWDEKRSGEDGFILNALKALEEEHPVVLARLVTKNEFQNINIDKVLEDYQVEDEPKTEKKAKASEPKPEPEPEPEADEPEADAEEVELRPGMKVAFKWKGEPHEGVIKEILEAENRIKIKSGGMVYPLKGDDDSIEVIDGKLEG